MGLTIADYGLYRLSGLPLQHIFFWSFPLLIFNDYFPRKKKMKKILIRCYIRGLYITNYEIILGLEKCLNTSKLLKYVHRH